MGEHFVLTAIEKLTLGELTNLTKKMIFNLKHIFREVKFGFQRMFRGYSDEVYWGFEDYFLQVIPALKEFCEEQTKNKEFIELNPDTGMIFSETLKLIKAFEEAP